MKKNVILTLVVLLISIHLQAQTACPNEVKNGDFEAGNTNFTSGLVSNCGCGSGTFCINTNFNLKCANWPNFGNHTPGGKNFLIVDGNTAAATNVWATTVASTPGNTYTFSFWVASVYPTNQQAFDLGMVVNGVTVRQFTISQAVPGWVQYSYSGICPAGATTIPIAIRQMSGGEFRDFGLDDIYFACCECKADYTTTNLDNCRKFQFNNTSVGLGLTYSWDFGDLGSGVSNNTSNLPNPVHEFSACGKFEVCLTLTGNGCSSKICYQVDATDNIPPLIACPRNLTVNTNPGQCYYTGALPEPSYSDNCSKKPEFICSILTPAFSILITPQTQFPKGVNTISCIARDECGNTSRACVYTLTVVDKEPPIIICPPNVTVLGTLNVEGMCKAVVINIAPKASDNCPMLGVNWRLSGSTIGQGIGDASGTNFMQGVTTVPYIATDMEGNKATCSFEVKVLCDTSKCACSPNSVPQQNMVNNGSFSFGDLGFTSDLTPGSSCGTGTYGVGTNFTGFCANWNNLVDNTSGTGQFLMIDGTSIAAGANVWESSTAAFVATRTYCFSFYSALAFVHPQQNFPLEINLIDNFGNVVYTVGTVPINSTPWTPHQMTFTLPSSFPSGTYSIAIRQITGGLYRDFGLDDICLQEIKKPIDSCVCKPDAVVTLTKGGNTYTIGCGRRPFVPIIPCSTDSAIISTNFGCVAPDGTFCQSPSMVSWQLQGPSGVIQNGNLSSSLLLKFPNNLVKATGTYTLILKTVCPNSADTCVCISNWVQEECDTCCQSRDLFSQAITNAVSITTTTDYTQCKATFNVGSLSRCYYIERINWGDGMQSNGTFSTGAMPMHVYANGGTYIITYLAIARNSVTGFICFEKFFSDTIKINCCELCQRNLVRNPGFFQGAVAGDLGEGGLSTNWLAGSSTPQVAQSDSCCDAYSIQMWGSQNLGESICQINMNFVQGKRYRIKFCGRFYNDPGFTTNYVRFGFTAMNSCVNPFSCSVGSCENIGASGSISNTNWAEYQLVDWTPTQNWSTLNIRAFNNNNYPNISFGRIDNICIVEVDSIRTSTRDFLSHQIPIRIFPNPTLGSFSVELHQPATTGMTLRVTDLAGRLVLEKQTQTGNILQTVQVENLPGGMYLLQVVEKGRVVGVEKFVKQ